MADTLNAAQRDAVLTPRGPLLVLAGAGTGKTRVVTHRIARLIGAGIRPERILAVTFTNKAAEEMQVRVRALLGKGRDQRPEVSTFHSLCVRILRRHITRLGYPALFAIYDRSDQESLARGALRELRVGDAALRPADLLRKISHWKAHSIHPDAAGGTAESDRDHLAAAGYARYQRALKSAGAVDFDDLLLCTERLFHQFADVRQQEAGRFDHVLVDEYQDTSAPQYQVVRALAAGHRNLCVVGDDDQSIYGWRGAEVSHILRFQQDWPEARVVRLEENYRSTGPILALANRLIAHNLVRHEKQLRAFRTDGEPARFLQFDDEFAEARGIVTDLRLTAASRRLSLRDMAILFRTNEQPRALETELRRANVPYVLVGGMSFYDRKEVRDTLAYLKLLSNPNDDPALLRVVNTPPRGLGKKAVERITAEAVSRGISVWEQMQQASTLADLSPAVVAAAERFCGLVRRFGERVRQEPPSAVASALVDTVGYRDEISRMRLEPSEAELRWQGVEHVLNALAAYEKESQQPRLEEFLDRMALAGRDDPEEAERRLAREAVVLMTLHGAKGLEFPHVYLVGMEEGLLPHRRALEVGEQAVDEERRLCYVGVTRARDRLTLTLARHRHKWGKMRPTIPSRFLLELMGSGEEATPPAQAAQAGQAAALAARRGKQNRGASSRVNGARGQRASFQRPARGNPRGRAR